MSVSIPANAESLTDRELLDQCLAPRKRDRDAFAALVSRYQSLVCSVAYSIVGDLGRSEDIAQDAFVAAWKQLDQLRDREKFKSWVCGIARNLAHKAIAKHPSETMLVHDSALDVEPPDEQSISREEADLLWRALDGLPENYREPLVLYYREEQSVAHVAGALDLSESAVKQRLARGRELMRGSVTELLENALVKTRPGPVFTLAVMGALPGVLFGSASAAGAAGAGVKASTVAGAGLTGAFLGILGGFGGAYAGHKFSESTARYESQRQVLRNNFVGISLISLIYVGLLILLRDHWIAAIGVTAVYITILMVVTARIAHRYRKITAESIERGDPQIPPGSIRKFLQRWKGRRYESPAQFLGIPLVSIQFADLDRDMTRFGTVPGGKRETARGWIAIGDQAVGLIAIGNRAVGGVAMGGLAMGGVAFGGLAVGGISLGGLAIGALCFGGGAIGLAAIGGGAVGYYAYGGGAIALKAASGGGAIARDFAVGGAARATHANDEIAASWISQHEFFTLAERCQTWVEGPWFHVVVFGSIALQLGLIFCFGYRRATQSERLAAAEIGDDSRL